MGANNDHRKLIQRIYIQLTKINMKLAKFGMNQERNKHACGGSGIVWEKTLNELSQDKEIPPKDSPRE
jgi:hypothetical protein